MRRRLLAVLLLVAMLGLVGISASAASGAPEPSPTPGERPTPSDPRAPAQDEPQTPPQPDGIKIDADGGFLSRTVGRAIAWVFRQIVLSALRPVFSLLGKTVLSTPAVTEEARVRDLWRIIAVVANAVLGIFILAGAGIITISNRYSSQRTAREMLPRLLVAATLVNVSLVLVGAMIEISNGVSRGLLGSATAAAALPQQMEASIAGALEHGLFLVLFAIAVVVLGVAVLSVYVLRVLILLIAVIVAPLFLIAHSLPQSEDWARLWWRVVGAVLLIPVAQALLFAIATRIVLSQSLEAFQGAGPVIDLLMVAGILYLAYKIPAFALQKALSAPASSGWRRVHSELMAMAAKQGA